MCNIGPYLGDMTRTYLEVNDGLLPASPTLIIGTADCYRPLARTAGQTHLMDPGAFGAWHN